MSSSKRWISPRDVTGGARMRLFCLPHAGSGAAAFYRWRGRLPDGVDLCPVHLPGRERRMAEASHTDAGELVDELMAALAPYLDRPFTIFGHSMGALLGYEWARRMHATGGSPELLVVSGRDAPQMPKPHHDLHRLEDKDLEIELRARYDGVPEGLFDDAEMRAIFLPILRADLKVVETYEFVEFLKLSCPILAAVGRLDRSVSAQGLDAWGQLTRSDFESASFAGDHFYLHAEGGKTLLERLSTRLEAILEAILKRC